MINVLDKGFVKLVDFMGSDVNIVNAARISYDKRVDAISEKDVKLLDYLWENKHTSPFRHATIQFHIKAPIFIFRQWQKHQVGCAWNEKSARYTRFDVECYRPSVFRLQHKKNKQSSYGNVEDNESALKTYDHVINTAINAYYELLASGVCKEQARMILPQNMYTECYWTASLQAAMHFLELREDEHSQWEMQQYAKATRVLMKPLFKNAMAKCTK